MDSYIKIPLINFSNLKQESPAWESVKMELKKALEEYGCFEATFDEIPVHLRESVVDGIKQVFDLPLETKLRTASDEPFSGYLGNLKGYPLYESLGIADVLAPQKVETFTNLLWPHHNPTFSKSMHSYATQLHQLDLIIRTMVLQILGLEKYLDEHLGSTNYRLRFQKYDVPPTNETELGLQPHTDKNLVTILYQNGVGGLQIEAKGEWTTVEPSTNSFLVFIGDAFHAWTNGRVHATNHRVMLGGEKVRYSIGLFTFPKLGYIIEAPQEMVDEDHPLLFKPYESSQLYDFVFANAHLDKTVTVKDFCGT